ncbi:hypothetical protein [Algivirga pacifica]
MKKRVAKKILTNQETLNYNNGQIHKAKNVIAKVERRNAKAGA